MPLSLSENKASSDIVMVKAEDCGPVRVVSEHLDPASNISQFRFNPSLSNNLILSYIEGPASKTYQLSEGVIETRRECKIQTHYKVLSKENQLPIFIFQMVRDSKKDKKNLNLAFINDVIQKFLANNSGINAKLLIPLFQCCSQKQHNVLVEVTLEGKKKEITIITRRILALIYSTQIA